MIANNPLCIVCYPQLLNAYLHTENFEKAEELQRSRIALVNDFGGRANLAHVLVAAGRPGEALEIYERLAEAHKSQGQFKSYESEWLLTSAIALHDLGRLDEVAERLALLKSKQDPLLAFRLATYYAHIGDKDIALAQLREMMERKPSYFEYVMRERDLAYCTIRRNGRSGAKMRDWTKKPWPQLSSIFRTSGTNRPLLARALP